MDLGATEHMTFHMVTVDTYEIVAPHNVYLDDDSIIK